ncbi:uncharacterized protein BJ171DRAFT_544122 [Polychytrium aggregatum]|uniref:uncharacterized protein n=1 Tax=Polychytrium aggregatum TaxID=110093 RepID=UPI0022FDCA62|nr:uncharacterized protein BJ171DRAFT_552907 [Polychytrium aggregatum]XP_052961546.1 uncharacterized protein BJ171DRAFT_544122 [Polychytrium aggregatum]KAI9183779.1 hypothetical protein BJ171DRAFT_552907 [Polychytrium aggregatum]KAI9190569.1 hypothetical protein BJ171DRAFT_544122 [Polychytrium aggregatum]
MIRLWSGFVSGSCWAQLSLQRAGLWQSAHTSFTRKRITAAISALLPTSNLDSTSSWDMCREWPRSRGPLDSIFITGLGLKEGQSRPQSSLPRTHPRPDSWHHYPRMEVGSCGARPPSCW